MVVPEKKFIASENSVPEKKFIASENSVPEKTFTGEVNTGELNPEQQQHLDSIQRYEQSIPGKIQGGLEAPMRFITGEGSQAEEYQKSMEAKNKGQLLQHELGGSLSRGLKLGAMALPVTKFAEGATIIAGLKPIVGKIASLAERAIPQAGLFGAARTAQSIGEGKDTNTAINEGLKEGVVVGAVDASLGGVVAPAVKGTYNALKKYSAPAMESRVAKVALEKTKEGIRNIGRMATDISEKTQIAIDQLQNKAKDLLRVVKLKTSDMTEKHVAKVKNEIGTQDVAINSLAKDIDKQAYELVKPMSEAIPALRSNFKKDYDTLLERDGMTPVQVQDTLDTILEVSGIVPQQGMTPKQKLLTVSQFLLSKIPEASADAKGLKQIASDAIQGIDGEISLKDAHWLKQSLYKYSGQLMSNPAEKQLGFQLKDAAKSLADNIDAQVGGDYASLSNRYRDYAAVKDYVESAIGKERYLPDGSKLAPERQNVATKLVSQVEDVVKHGGELTDPVYQAQNDAIKAFYSQSDILRQNGQEVMANQLEDKLGQIANSYRSLNNIKLQKKALEETLGNNPEVEALNKMLDTHVYNIGKKVSTLKTENLLAKSALKDEKRALENIADIERGKILKNDEMQYLTFALASGSLGKLASAAGLPAVSPITTSLIAMYGLKKYGPMVADMLLQQADKLVGYINKSPLPQATRKSLLLLVDKLQND